MKRWIQPEAKVMSIKMSENIAASVPSVPVNDQGQVYLYTKGVYNDANEMWNIQTYKQAYYHYDSSMGIQDTGLQPVSSKGLWVVPGSGSAFSGCLA